MRGAHTALSIFEKTGLLWVIPMSSRIGKFSAHVQKDIDHIHVVKQNPIPVNTHLQAVIGRNFQELLRLHRRGVKIIFPDITRLENQKNQQIVSANPKTDARSRCLHL